MTAIAAEGAVERTRIDPLEVARELSAVVLTLTILPSLGRLWQGSAFRGELFIQVLLAHLVVVVLRRRGFSVSAAAIVTAIVAFIAVVLVEYPSTTRLGVPTHDTFATMNLDVSNAWHEFGRVVPPAPALTGFLVVSAFAIWASAFIADWAAFRLEVPFEAILPASTVFIFGAVLGTARGRALATTCVLVSVLGFLLTQRVCRQVRLGRWVVFERHRGAPTLLAVGGLLGTLALLAAAFVGPSLPGATSKPLIDVDPPNGQQSRITISPLVDIRNRLVEQSDVEVFKVTASERAYWRLTSLDDFDGRIWSSSGSYGKAKGRLPATTGEATKAEAATQKFSIESLAAIWLPAAFDPVAVSAKQSVRFDESSSTLIVDTDTVNSDSLKYEVQSRLPRFEPNALDAAGVSYPKSILDHDLGLPADFSTRARQLARQVTAGAKTPYAAAVKLQNYFRDNFKYDLEVPPGHSDRDLDRFLFVEQRGYCEQFAGSYAALARALNIPARVAVGFTPGDQTKPGTYRVLGRNAHAWPEVFMPGQGWVAFEPTPGRGAPFAENYTGVPEQQVSGRVGADTAVATTLPPRQPTGSTPTTRPGPAEVDTDSPEQQPADRNTGPSTVSGLWLWLALVFAAILLLALAYVVLVPLAHAARRDRRRRNAVTPDAQVALAWEEALEQLQAAGLAPRPSATHAETAASGAVLLADPTPLHRVAAIAQTALFSADGAHPGDEAEAWAAAEEIARSVHDGLTAEQRWRRKLDIRPLLPSRRRRRVNR